MARDTWHPPGFAVPEILKQAAETLDMSSAVLSVEIPYHEQFSGKYLRCYYY